MKKKQFEKKLVLNKTTIARLDIVDLKDSKGGANTYIYFGDCSRGPLGCDGISTFILYCDPDPERTNKSNCC